MRLDHITLKGLVKSYNNCDNLVEINNNEIDANDSALTVLILSKLLTLNSFLNLFDTDSMNSHTDERMQRFA